MPKLEAADAAALGDAAAARDELVHYCRFTTPPRFAAGGEAQRMAALEAIAKAAGVPLATPAPAAIPAAESEVVRSAQEALRRDPAPELGLLGAKILGAALSGLCASAGAREVLPATCALGGEPSLGELRLALVRDVAQIFVRRAGERAPAAVRLLSVLVEHDGARAIAPIADSVIAPPCADATCAAASRAGRIGAAIVARVLADGPRIDRDKERYRNVAEVVVAGLENKPDYKLGADAAAAVDDLVAAIRAADDEQRLALHARRADVRPTDRISRGSRGARSQSSQSSQSS